SCSPGDVHCEACRECRIDYEIGDISMRDDLCLSDSQYSYITGIGFTFPYCLFLLVFGWAVDRFRHLVVEMLVAAQVGLAV
ncbi:unnamed protein product, partial [Heterosigma akashiwo]